MITVARLDEVALKHGNALERGKLALARCLGGCPSADEERVQRVAALGAVLG